MTHYKAQNTFDENYTAIVANDDAARNAIQKVSEYISTGANPMVDIIPNLAAVSEMLTPGIAKSVQEEFNAIVGNSLTEQMDAVLQSLDHAQIYGEDIATLYNIVADKNSALFILLPDLSEPLNIDLKDAIANKTKIDIEELMMASAFDMAQSMFEQESKPPASTPPSSSSPSFEKKSASLPSNPEDTPWAMTSGNDLEDKKPSQPAKKRKSTGPSPWAFK